MKNWKSFLLLLLVFAAGISVGAVGMREMLRHSVRQAVAHPENAQMIVERKLAWKLRLDEAQRLKMHEILKAARGQMKVLRHDFQPQMQSVAGAADVKILALLTPEQQARYELFKKEERPLFPGLTHPAP